MKRSKIHPLLFFVLMGFLFTAYIGCSKEDSSEKHPPNGVPTCGDGIMNQGEFRVDCGGPCSPCALAPSMSATIDSFWVDPSVRGSGYWEADSLRSYAEPGGFFLEGLHISSAKKISFTHTQGLERGVYIYDDIDGATFGCELMDGIVEIIAVDKVKRTVSGNFSFNCLGNSSGKKERIIDGKFRDITYKK